MVNLVLRNQQTETDLEQAWEQALLKMDSQRGIYSKVYKEPCYLPLSFPRYFKDLTPKWRLTLTPETEAGFVDSLAVVSKLQQDWVYAQSVLKARDNMKRMKASVKQ